MDAPTVTVGTVSATRPPFPYPGLRPFESEEWLIFFGRETMIDEVIGRLAREHLVLIHGASGSGKSSLVRAGVLPKLARQHLRHGAQWLTCAMRPSGGPLWSLATELARLEERSEDIEHISEIMRLFNRRGATLSGVVGALDRLAGKRLCILIDQFEELFRFERETSREEAELFVDLLIGELPGAPEIGETAAVAATDAGRLHVIITMRSEFLGECARFDGFAEAVNRTQYLVPPLTQPALMHAIQQPALLYGGEITTELAERLIADVHGKLDELPLIQHGLMLFWHAAAQAGADGRIVIDSAALESAGGLAQLLSDHAWNVMNGCVPTPADKAVVERLFRSLTDINAEGQAIRRPQSFRDLVAVCGVAADRLKHFIDAFRADGVSFLTPYFPTAITDKTIIDISHEALIRYWRAIADPQSGWLRREFSDGLVWQSMLLEAREFQQDKRRLLSPATTTERRRWLAERTPRWSERYGGNWPLVNRFVRASSKAIVRRRRIRRLWLLPAVCMAAIAPPLIINESLFDAFKKDTESFGGAVAVLIFCCLLANIIAIAIDYGYALIVNVINRVRRGTREDTSVQLGRRGRRKWTRWLDRVPTTWAVAKNVSVVLLVAAYAAGLGYIFREVLLDPAKFDLKVARAADDSSKYGDALTWYRKAASYENAEAEYAIGWQYYRGSDTLSVDYAQAMLWFRKAGDQGHAEAEYQVGVLYENGYGVPLDYRQAMTWFHKAADQDDDGAQNEIGVLYYNGSGVGRDFGQAIAWFRKAADRGNAAANNNLGVMYEDGSGVDRDYRQAMIWFRKAADRGSASAADNIGALYENALGVDQDYAQAMVWYRKAAEKGAANAQYHLATMYEGGRGVPPDEGLAFEWMRKAAAAGEERAKRWLSTSKVSH